jgi:nucleotide-binding universal stress UspA family protein
MKILLPVDGSTSSTHAARYVSQHINLFGRKSSVILVNVDPPALERISAQISSEDIARFHTKNANAAVRAARRVLERARIAFRERLLVGEPGGTIAKLARQERCDLIVMGSHGRGAFKSLLLGSVVSKVISGTRIPVLVVR